MSKKIVAVLVLASSVASAPSAQAAFNTAGWGSQVWAYELYGYVRREGVYLGYINELTNRFARSAKRCIPGAQTRDPWPYIATQQRKGIHDWSLSQTLKYRPASEAARAQIYTVWPACRGRMDGVR